MLAACEPADARAANSVSSGPTLASRRFTMWYPVPDPTGNPSDPPKRLRGDMAADSTQTYLRMAQQAVDHAPPRRRGGPLAPLRRWWPFGRRA